MFLKIKEAIKKNWIIKSIISLVILAIIIMICVMNIFLTNKYRHIDYDAVPYPIKMESGDVVTQQFHVKYPDLYTMGFCILDQTELKTGALNIDILSPDGDVVFTKEADLSKVLNGDFFRTEVNKKLTEGIEYILQISLVNADGYLLLGAIEHEANLSEFHGGYCLNGEEEEGISLALFMRYHLSATPKQKTYVIVIGIVLLLLTWLWNWIAQDKRYRNITICALVFGVNILIWKNLLWKGNEDFFKSFQNWIIVVLVIGFCGLMYLLFIKGENRVQRYFLLYSIVFGILYCAVWIPFSGFDERGHFCTAYAMSSHVLGKPAITGEEHYVLFEEQDAIDIMKLFDATKDYTLTYYQDLCKSTNKSENIVYIEHGAFHSLSTYTVMEIPQAIGVTVGRILGLNLFGLILSGRIANFIFFVACFYISIKIIPFGKWILFAISQFPSVSIIRSSLSYDVTVIGLICLYVSYVLYLVFGKKKVNLWELILAGVLAIIIGPLKWVYFPLIILLVLIKVDNVKKWIYYLIILATVIISVRVCIDTVHGKYLNTTHLRLDETNNNKVYYDDPVAEIHEDDSEEEYSFVESPEFSKYTVPFMISNPQYTIETIIKSIYSDLDTYVFSIFGGRLDSEHGYGLSITLLALELAMFLFVLFVDEGAKVSISNGTCIISVMAFLSTFLMVFFSFLWGGGAVADYKDIFGIQGRYFIPTFFPLILVFKRIGISNIDVKKQILLGYAFLQMYAILNSCNVVWKR